MDLKSKIENKIASLRTSILKSAEEQKFLRAYFLKLSFNLMLCALKLWKQRESQSQSSKRASQFENRYWRIKKIVSPKNWDAVKHYHSIGVFDFPMD